MANNFELKNQINSLEAFDENEFNDPSNFQEFTTQNLNQNENENENENENDNENEKPNGVQNENILAQNGISMKSHVTSISGSPTEKQLNINDFIEEELDANFSDSGDPFEFFEQEIQGRILQNLFFLSDDSDWTVDQENSKDGKIKLSSSEINNNASMFRTNFLGKEFDNIVINHAEEGYIVISILTLKEGKQINYQILMTTKKETKFFSFNKKDMKISNGCCQGTPLRKIIQKVDNTFYNLPFDYCEEQKTDENDLLAIEDSTSLHKFKFGIIFFRQNLRTEEQIFLNRNTSKNYKDFLDLLGDQIELKNFSGYKGGLDTKYDTHGKFSIYTNWNNFEIMFHVASLFPLNGDNKQEAFINIKKHIGNDVVLLVFLDGDHTVFDPSVVISKQIHIIIAVKSITSLEKPDETEYIIQTIRKKCVSEFKPNLPESQILKKNQVKDFLLSKACMGEKIATSSGPFKTRIQQYRKNILQGIYERYHSD